MAKKISYILIIRKQKKGPLNKIDFINIYSYKPLLKDLNGNSLRFFIDPAGDKYKYAIYLSDNGDNTPYGIIRRFYEENGILNYREKIINISPEKFKSFIENIWSNNVGFEGSDKICLDSTKFAYDLKYNGKIISGTSWRGCSEHYYDLARFLQVQIKEWMSPTGLPENDGWTYRYGSNEEF